MYAKPKARTSTIKTIAAPTKGLNDTDSLANMDPMFALTMRNVFPDSTSVRVRNGYRQWATGLVQPGKTLMVYNRGTGADNLFVCADNGIFEVTITGAVGSAVSALTLGSVDYTNFGNVAGQYMVVVNGQDAAKLYDGTTWVDFTTVVTPSAPGQVSGVSMSTMVCVQPHKKRLWFAQKDSLTAWYLPTDGVGGVMTPFYLGGVFKRGGYITNIFTWSIDSGDGLDDILVFQTNLGEIAGYQGTDPSSITTWALASVYYPGPPLTRNGTTDIAGDVAMLTSNGIHLISNIVGGQQSLAASTTALSRNISKTLNDIVQDSGSQPNWSIFNVHSLNSLVVVIPNLFGTGNVQYVMNTITGAWTSYDLPMDCVAVRSEKMYFCGTKNSLNYVFMYDPTSNLDNIDIQGLNGNFIQSYWLQAHNFFEMMGTDKIFSLVRPLFVSTGRPAMLLNVGTDFQPNSPLDLPVPASGANSSISWDSGVWDLTLWLDFPAPTSSDAWDSGIWDTSLWNAAPQTQYSWTGVTGIGYSASLAVRLSTERPTEFVSVDWAFQAGNSL